MNSTRHYIAGWGRGSSVLLAAAALGGCLQTAPVVVTPQDQAARLLFTCANGRTLDVTRVQGSASVLVVTDGRTLQLPRDTSLTTAERYTNRLQTLTLYGSSASFETLGQSSYGPCTVSGGGGYYDDQGQPLPTRRRRESSD
jgi:hypothetical protein